MYLPPPPLAPPTPPLPPPPPLTHLEQVEGVEPQGGVHEGQHFGGVDQHVPLQQLRLLHLPLPPRRSRFLGGRRYRNAQVNASPTAVTNANPTVNASGDDSVIGAANPQRFFIDAVGDGGFESTCLRFCSSRKDLIGGRGFVGDGGGGEGEGQDC